ncbi:hypothetical protein M0804_009030 [Polistes exclamans]|nr:hypothetical protein M0804_009030 [Polistes exclamans]
MPSVFASSSPFTTQDSFPSSSINWLPGKDFTSREHVSPIILCMVVVVVVLVVLVVLVVVVVTYSNA